MSDQLRKCGHPLGVTSWCPDCELAEARASGEFRKGYATTTHGRAAAHTHEAADRSAEAKNAARWRYAMDWATKDFAVCYREEDAWTPMKTNGPIDAAMGTPAAAEPGKGSDRG